MDSRFLCQISSVCSAFKKPENLTACIKDTVYAQNIVIEFQPADLYAKKGLDPTSKDWLSFTKIKRFKYLNSISPF